MNETNRPKGSVCFFIIQKEKTMIRVPELKTGEQPFDPDTTRIVNPWKEPAIHSFKMGMTTENTQTPKEQTDTLLNLAVVKETITAFHRDEDDEMRRLETFTSTQICDITAEHEKFLRARMAAAENACKNEEQKSLFRAMTKNFLTRSRQRAAALQQRKTLEFWRESVEAQNKEFLNRALRDENVTNDAAVAQYRHLIFYNLENMLNSFPEAERKTCLAEANRAFYRKVLEKLLELAPEAALKMTERKEPRHALGDPECDAIAARAQTAMHGQTLTATATLWAEEGKTPEEAAELAQKHTTDAEEQKHLLHQYRLKRFTESKIIIQTRIATLATLWNDLKEHNFDENALPAGVTRNTPNLAECLRTCLQKQADAGGAAVADAAVDYPHFMKFLTKFKKAGLWETMEWLRTEDNFHSLLIAAGGPGAESWTLCTRLLTGAAEPEDAETVTALHIAWAEEEAGREAGIPKDVMPHFAAELRALKEKRSLAVRELIQKFNENRIPNTVQTNNIV